MRISAVLAAIGLFVVVLMFASAGIFQGDMCFGSIGCVGADGGGLRFHSPDSKAKP